MKLIRPHHVRNRSKNKVLPKFGQDFSSGICRGQWQRKICWSFRWGFAVKVFLAIFPSLSSLQNWHFAFRFLCFSFSRAHLFIGCFSALCWPTLHNSAGISNPLQIQQLGKTLLPDSVLYFIARFKCLLLLVTLLGQKVERHLA